MANVLREIREQQTRLHISRDFDTWAIYSSANVRLGVINRRIAVNLASLPVGDKLDYEAFMERSKLEETIESYLKGNKKVQFDIVLNITGPVSISEAVGQQLSKFRLFLQRPYQLPEGTTYDNPQYLALDDTLQDGLEDDEGEGEASTIDPFDDDQLLAQDDMEGELWSIIDNSSLPEEKARIEIDQSIHTTLMEYAIHRCQAKGNVSELTLLA